MIHATTEQRLPAKQDLVAAATTLYAEGRADDAVAELARILDVAPSSAAALRLLKEIRKTAEIRPDRKGKAPLVDLVLSYDGCSKDRRFLLAVAQFIKGLSTGLALYGFGRFTKYLFKMMPGVRRHVHLIVDDDPTLQGTTVGQIPIIGPEAIPRSLTTVLLCTTRMVAALAMRAGLRRRRIAVRQLPLTVATHLDPGAIPDAAWLSQPQSIYPFDLQPEVEIQSGLDFLLLELPPRQIPMMPYGVGYVHNILKQLGIRQQTVDLNVIFYHRYYCEHLLCHTRSELWGDDDPWDGLFFHRWDTEEAVTYFGAAISEVVEQVSAARPKILGISIRHGVHPIARAVIDGIKARYPEIIVVVGGYDCLSHLNISRRFDRFDYMVIGEAEGPLPGLVRELLAGRKPRDLPGIRAKIDSPDRQWVDGTLPTDLDAVPFPKYDWNDIRVYHAWNGGHATPFSISRGCAWSRCNFCGERFCFRTRDPLLVVDELEWHARRGFDNFVSMESDINGDPAVLTKVCEEIIRRGLRIRISGQFRVDRRNTPEFFRLLRAAGFWRIVFGVDGWNDHTLRLQRKGYNFKFVEQNLRDCRAAGIEIHVNMVLGVPGETDADVDECIANMIRNRHNFDVVSTCNMVRLIPGSTYYNSPERFNIKFRGDRDEIYGRDPSIIDEKLWYSEEPYIDHQVRVARYKKMRDALLAAGVGIGEYARVENAREIEKLAPPSPSKDPRSDQAVEQQPNCART